MHAVVQPPQAVAVVPRTSLPSADAPLVLQDGTAIAPATAQTFQRIEIPSNSEAMRIVSSTRRKLVDMPALPKQMNSYAVVLCYTASGLSDAEIAVATKLSVPQIQQLRTHAAYTHLETMIVEAVKEQSSQAVADILAQGEQTAARTMVSLTESENDSVALSASRELLHMRGYKAAEKVDIRTQMLNTFRIEVVDKRESNAPVIDMEAVDGNSQ